jgi:hypothetical protein
MLRVLLPFLALVVQTSALNLLISYSRSHNRHVSTSSVVCTTEGLKLAFYAWLAAREHCRSKDGRKVSLWTGLRRVASKLFARRTDLLETAVPAILFAASNNLAVGLSLPPRDSSERGRRSTSPSRAWTSPPTRSPPSSSCSAAPSSTPSSTPSRPPASSGSPSSCSRAAWASRRSTSRAGRPRPATSAVSALRRWSWGAAPRASPAQSCSGRCRRTRACRWRSGTWCVAWAGGLALS